MRLAISDIVEETRQETIRIPDPEVLEARGIDLSDSRAVEEALKDLDPEKDYKDVLVQYDIRRPEKESISSVQGLEVFPPKNGVRGALFLVPDSCGEPEIPSRERRAVYDSIPVFSSPGHPLHGLKLLPVVPAGMGDMEIGEDLSLTPITVDEHRKIHRGTDKPAPDDPIPIGGDGGVIDGRR